MKPPTYTTGNERTRTQTVEMYWCIERNDDEIELLITGEVCRDPGRVNGPAELCYPPSFETRIVSAEQGETKKDWVGLLTPQEELEIMEHLVELAEW